MTDKVCGLSKYVSTMAHMFVARWIHKAGQEGSWVSRHVKKEVRVDTSKVKSLTLGKVSACLNWGHIWGVLV